MMIQTPALWAAIAALVPLMMLTCYTDLKRLKIPNLVVLAVFGVFVVTGLWGLPWDVFLWRLLSGFIMLAIGFWAFSTGVVGGDDAKMAAALAPFVVPYELLFVLLLFALTSIALTIVLWIVWKIVGKRETGWKAIDQFGKPMWKREFPVTF